MCRCTHLQFKPGGRLRASAVDLGTPQPLLAVGGVARRALTDEAVEIFDELRREGDSELSTLLVGQPCASSPCHLGQSSRCTVIGGPNHEHGTTLRGSA